MSSLPEDYTERSKNFGNYSISSEPKTQKKETKRSSKNNKIESTAVQKLSSSRTESPVPTKGHSGSKIKSLEGPAQKGDEIGKQFLKPPSRSSSPFSVASRDSRSSSTDSDISGISSSSSERLSDISVSSSRSSLGAEEPEVEVEADITEILPELAEATANIEKEIIKTLKEEALPLITSSKPNFKKAEQILEFLEKEVGNLPDGKHKDELQIEIEFLKNAIAKKDTKTSLLSKPDVQKTLNTRFEKLEKELGFIEQETPVRDKSTSVERDKKLGFFEKRDSKKDVKKLKDELVLLKRRKEVLEKHIDAMPNKEDPDVRKSSQQLLDEISRETESTLNQLKSKERELLVSSKSQFNLEEELSVNPRFVVVDKKKLEAGENILSTIFQDNERSKMYSQMGKIGFLKRKLEDENEKLKLEKADLSASSPDKKRLSEISKRQKEISAELEKLKDFGNDKQLEKIKQFLKERSSLEYELIKNKIDLENDLTNKTKTPEEILKLKNEIHDLERKLNKTRLVTLEIEKDKKGKNKIEGGFIKIIKTEYMDSQNLFKELTKKDKVLDKLIEKATDSNDLIKLDLLQAEKMVTLNKILYLSATGVLNKVTEENFYAEEASIKALPREDRLKLYDKADIKGLSMKKRLDLLADQTSTLTLFKSDLFTYTRL